MGDTVLHEQTNVTIHNHIMWSNRPCGADPCCPLDDPGGGSSSVQGFKACVCVCAGSYHHNGVTVPCWNEAAAV